MREKLSEVPCPLCLKLFEDNKLRLETIQRLPKGALAPLDSDGNKICWDCNTAFTLCKLGNGTFEQHNRIAVANDRQEQYRAPGSPIGLAQKQMLMKNEEGDLEDQHRWLDEVIKPKYNLEDTNGFHDTIKKMKRS